MSPFVNRFDTRTGDRTPETREARCETRTLHTTRRRSTRDTPIYLLCIAGTRTTHYTRHTHGPRLKHILSQARASIKVQEQTPCPQGARPLPYALCRCPQATVCIGAHRRISIRELPPTPRLDHPCPGHPHLRTRQEPSPASRGRVLAEHCSESVLHLHPAALRVSFIFTPRP